MSYTEGTPHINQISNHYSVYTAHRNYKMDYAAICSASLKIVVAQIYIGKCRVCRVNKILYVDHKKKAKLVFPKYFALTV